MNDKKQSHVLIEKLFSVNAPKKINIWIHELNEINKLLETNSENQLVKDRFIELNCNCGDFFIKNEQYEQAKPYFEAADRIAYPGHYTQFHISVMLLTIAEKLLIK